MENTMIPGTVLPWSEFPGGAFTAFLPMIKAADGLTSAQVCAITGLEYSTVQNWVKRGFVAHPIKKKYYEKHLARILIISMLRDGLKIDDIGELLRLINGDATDESDDMIAETALYDCLCEVIAAAPPGVNGADLDQQIRGAVSRYTVTGDTRRLTDALAVMVHAYRASRSKREAERGFAALKEAAVKEE